MTWTDLSSDIQSLMKSARDHMRAPAAVMHDPAITDLAVDLHGGEVWWRQSGDLLPTSQQKLASVKRLPAQFPTDDSVYFLKIAEPFRVRDLTRPASDFFSYAKNLLGGDNALTTTLAGSGLAALGGYGIGRVADAVVPSALRTIIPRPAGHPDDDKHELIGKSHWAPTLATMGAIGGALPGLVQMGAAASTGNSIMTPYPWLKSAEDAYEDMPFQEQMNSTGALFQPSIPVDAFNQAIWASSVPNPFGTKSRFGDNEQTLYTPPQTAAMIGGLVSATGAAKQKNTVSPWDVAQVATQAAISGGAGLVAGAATGLMAGKVLGALAGLTPLGQQYAQRTGMWAGLLNGLAQKLF